MRRSEIRAFVEGYLRHSGARIEHIAPELIRVTMPRTDSSKSGSGAVRVLAFGPRAHRSHPGAELVAIGSASLNRLVGEATRNGRYAVAYRPEPEGEGRQPISMHLPHVTGADWGRPRRAYRPLFLFVYLAEYHTIDVPDDLEFIAYDPAHGHVLQSPVPLQESLQSCPSVAPQGWETLPASPRPADLVASLAELDRRMQRRARRVKEASAIEIARETANIEAYYRQLIDEARHPVGRAQLSTEEEAERVRTLQLDWKRRVQEVQRFWEAYGDVRLCAVAAVMEPCWSIVLRDAGRRSRKTGAIHAVADFATGRMLELRCAACGVRLPKEAAVADGSLICRRHLAEQQSRKRPAAERAGQRLPAVRRPRS